nr:hypothetical protein CFP56_63807 [Quercus suber]
MLAMDGGTGMQAGETRYLGFLALDSLLFTHKLGQKAANLAKERKILKNRKDSPLETPLMARFQSSQQLKET